MQNADVSLNSWLPRAALIVAAVTLVRIVLLAMNQTDLFVDEAQYWFWGEDLDFGYYSKPPLIAWVIRASTEIGSDTAFWIRLPGSLCHAAVALLLGAVAARHSARAAVWAAALWITLPMVTVGSTLASTDSTMMPWLALALLAWLRCLDRGSDLRWAALAGLALGVAFLGKYAAVYYLICAPLAALVARQGRASLAAVGVALVTFAIAISPNLMWNLANGLSTLEHTMDNADWVRDPGTRAQLNLAGFLEFLASQFIVVGPVLFAALLWLGLRSGAGQGDRRVLLAFSLPILALVCLQSILSEAYANWAAATYLAGVVVVVPWLLDKHAAWLWGSLALNGAFALFIPLATAFGTQWTSGAENRFLLERYLGRVEMSETLLTLAQREALPLVADDRDVLADLFHTGRDLDQTIFARPESGRPSNHYAQTRAMPETLEGEVVFVTKRDKLPAACDTAEVLGTVAPVSGAYRKRPQQVARVSAQCLRP